MKTPESQQISFQLEYKYKIPIDDSDIKRSLEQAKIVGSDKFFEFQCVICQFFVYVPKKCNTCVAIFCETCIRKWFDQSRRQKGTNCPSCRCYLGASYTDANLVDLDRLWFYGCPYKECPLRGQQMTYYNLIQHLKTQCEYETVHCNAEGCTATFKHIECDRHFSECQYIAMKCQECEIVIQGWQNFKGHNCALAFKQKLQLANQTIEILRGDLQNEHNKALSYKYQVTIGNDRICELEIQNNHLKEQIEALKKELTDYKIQLNEIADLRAKLKLKKQKNVKKLTKTPLMKNQSLPQLLEKTIKSPMGQTVLNFKNTKPFFKVNERLFCTKHGIQLQRINAKTHPNCVCTFCTKSLSDSAKENNVEDHKFDGQKCMLCIISVCSVCENQNDFKKYIQ